MRLGRFSLRQVCRCPLSLGLRFYIGPLLDHGLLFIFAFTSRAYCVWTAV